MRFPGDAVNLLRNASRVREVVEPPCNCRPVNVAGFRALGREQVALNPRDVPAGNVLTEDDDYGPRAALSLVKLDVRLFSIEMQLFLYSPELRHVFNKDLGHYYGTR